MRELFTILFLLAFYFNSFSQGSNGGLSNLQGTQSNSLGQSMDALNSRGSWLPMKKKHTVDGTPLAYELGKNELVLITFGGDKYKIPNGNYNAQIDQFVSVMSKDSIFIINTNKVDYALMNNVKMKRFGAENTRPRYYEILGSYDDMYILNKYEARIKPGGVNKMTHEKTSNDRYYLVEDLFIKRGEDLKELKLNKRIVKYIFSDKEQQIKKYIKDNDLSIKKREDFLKVFDYYASLNKETKKAKGN